MNGNRVCYTALLLISRITHGYGAGTGTRAGMPGATGSAANLGVERTGVWRPKRFDISEVMKGDEGGGGTSDNNSEGKRAVAKVGGNER